ncbi:hypothetical protein Bhyg_17241 [Pseudolycoriella hygida]|uniref:Uncharacterized protein n=1 Tax=Pseudolycoriella hygida TaxID=35572 RepID=A0A9Q0RRX8_9DIPT|nr:hypothetical protein Bhyg_17241 [Pseudolycoriella hygida]
MNNIKQLKESQREAHPGFNSYLECMTRSFFTGLSAFVLIAASYKITKDRTNSCQAAWMASENKHTALKDSTEE